jgi:type II secretory pathway pseudopilin PulG
VELLIVVVVIGLLAGVATGTHMVMQRRAIERVEAGDLDAYAQAEMTARGDQGKFLAYDELVAAGFQGWSDDVELNQVETTRDRTYVRIRSRRTGYACALDLSPVTGSAWNRKICRDREDDPALAVPAGIAITAPGADTASVARPPAPAPLAADHLLPPDVGDGEDVVLAPGASRVVLFPVTNRSAEARTFTFSTASADPGLAPVPDLPAAARLQAGETASIPVSVSVAPGSSPTSRPRSRSPRRTRATVPTPARAWSTSAPPWRSRRPRSPRPPPRCGTRARPSASSTGCAI